MALARLRRSSRLVAVLLLATFWSVAHRGSDDGCLEGVLETHDESKHVMGVADGAAPDHCAVCHWVRSPRRPHGTPFHAQSPLLAGTLVDASEADSLRAPALDRLPARAPPAALI